jgi:hypothetical protein
MKVFGVDPVGSGQVPLVGSCKYSDELAGSGATELVSYVVSPVMLETCSCLCSTIYYKKMKHVSHTIV